MEELADPASREIDAHRTGVYDLAPEEEAATRDMLAGRERGEWTNEQTMRGLLGALWRLVIICYSQRATRDQAAEGQFVRTISIGAIALVLTGAPALAQVAGQPNLLDPHPAIANPRLAPAKPQPGPAAPAQAAPAKAQTAPPAKPPRAAAKPASTPESRSAAALALSADPVFDEGTYQRIKEALLSYAAVQVRGGWPSLPADAKLAPGASGPTSPCCAGVLSSPKTCPPERKPAKTMTKQWPKA